MALPVLLCLNCVQSITVGMAELKGDCQAYACYSLPLGLSVLLGKHPGVTAALLADSLQE